MQYRFLDQDGTAPKQTEQGRGVIHAMDCDALAADLRAIGATEHGDFSISARVDPSRLPSRELVGISEHEGSVAEVWCRDMGRTSTLMQTASADAARLRMIEEVDRLGEGRLPGRGLRASQP